MKCAGIALGNKKTLVNAGVFVFFIYQLIGNEFFWEVIS